MLNIEHVVSESFNVMKGLRQKCVLLPVLFSLYINSLVEKLRGAGGLNVEARESQLAVC